MVLKKCKNLVRRFLQEVDGDIRALREYPDFIQTQGGIEWSGFFILEKVQQTIF